MLALVTGASSGIGLQYATVLASEYRCDLLLVSNQEKEIMQTAQQLSATYGVQATGLYADLSLPNAAEQLYEYCRANGMAVDILLNNAGVFFFNDFVETAPARIELMLSLHIVTVTKLCRLFGEDMKRRGSGYILNMSSMSAWMALPGINVYNATKAYILNFSRSLWYELRPYNVSVTAVCPGAVDTGLYGLSDRLRRLAVRLGVSMTPDRLVKKSLKKMFKRKKQTLPGAVNHVFLPLIKHLPDWVVFAVARRLKPFQH